MFVCPFDAHWCDREACRTGICEMTDEPPLIACSDCGAVTASSPGFRLCVDCFTAQVEAVNEGA